MNSFIYVCIDRFTMVYKQNRYVVIHEIGKKSIPVEEIYLNGHAIYNLKLSLFK